MPDAMPALSVHFREFLTTIAMSASGRNLPDRRAAFSKLAARSLVNLEQARAGFRVSLIGNITVPVGALVLLNEFAPGWLAAMLREGTPNELIMIAVAWSVAAVLILGGTWWAFGGLSAARDLHHLLYLIHVERFGNVGAPSGLDADDDGAFPDPP